MKTEKEFMEDIYRKAAEQKLTMDEQPVQRKIPMYKRGQFIAVALLMIVVIPVGVTVMQGNKEIAQEPPLQSEYAIEPAEYRMVQESSNIFEGIIEQIEETDGMLSIRVTIQNEYRGNAGNEAVVRYVPEENESSQLQIGERALFYVISQGEEYGVNTEENGICRYVYTEDGAAVYESMDGEYIDTGSLQ